MGTSITIDDAALNTALQRALQVAPQETVKAVKDCILDLAANSASRAPIESGDLRNDCHAEINGVEVFARQAASSASVAASLMAAGTVGYSLPYALRQHEDLTLQHDRTDGERRADGTTVNMVAGGEAKYLERPFEEREGRYTSRFNEIVRRALP